MGWNPSPEWWPARPYHFRLYDMPVISSEAFVAEQKRKAENAVAFATQRQEIIDHEWREGVLRALEARGLVHPRDAVDACMRYWQGSRPYRCRRHRYCIDCLRWRTAAIWHHDLALLQSQHPQIATCRSPASRMGRNAMRSLAGYRRLHLPATDDYRWVLLPNGRIVISTVIQSLGGVQPEWCEKHELGALYDEPIEQLRSVGPERAVELALENPKRIRTTQAGGLLAQKIKWPKKKPTYYRPR